MIKLLNVPLVIAVIYLLAQGLAVAVQSDLSQLSLMTTVLLLAVSSVVAIRYGALFIDYLSRRFGLIFDSKVPGHEGPCYVVWLNTNQVNDMQAGGVTGFFKNTSGGDEFHGIIHEGKIYTTAGVYGRWRAPVEEQHHAA